jgi:transcriptional regulator with XRE-family HTH domain
MGDVAAKEDLREFLRSRRARIGPEEAGLPPGPGRRRVPGLRREELAMLAGVSVDYYTRLEQGRDVNVSDEVLDAVATVLRLDDVERAHLRQLAQPTSRRRRRSATPPQRVRPGVRRLLDGLTTPGFVIGRRGDVLATNVLARALLTDFDALPVGERNHTHWVLLAPEARERYVDWEQVARDAVAALRVQAARHPDDPRLTSLVGELTVRSPEFATWWAEHDVRVLSHGTKRYHHPVVGDLALSYEALPLVDDPEQVLYLYSVEPGSPSAEALALLASWTMGADRLTPQAPPGRPT